MNFGFHARWALRNLIHHQARTVLTIAGVALAVAILLGIRGFTRGYERSLHESIENMGFHVLVTAKGCPYEAATLILRGGQIPMYIDEEICREVEAHDNVDFVAKLFLQTLPVPEENRTLIFMGVEDSFPAMKPWLSFQRGGWFASATGDEAILGFNVANYLKLDVGDELRIEQFPRPLRVAGVFDRSGSQDDGTIFLPLAIAQKFFDKKDKLTGLGVRVKDLAGLGAFVEDAYDLPSVQVVSTAQIQGTLMRLVDSMRSVMMSIGVCALLIAAVSLMNTVLMSVYERTREFGILRAMGGGVRHLLVMVCMETALLTLGGAVLGGVLVMLLRGAVEGLVRAVLPFVPAGHILRIRPVDLALAVLLAVVVGVVCSTYPALRAARIRPLRSLWYGE